MSDRIDREINEILERLDRDKKLPSDPVPISSARRRPGRRPPERRKPVLPSVEPAALMFSGAGVMLAGLVLSAIAGFFIWAAFAGVVMFIAAFLISFARGWPRQGASAPRSSPGGAYWRDRYIEYDSSSDSPWSRIKRRFRR